MRQRRTEKRKNEKDKVNRGGQMKGEQREKAREKWSERNMYYHLSHINKGLCVGGVNRAAGVPPV